MTSREIFVFSGGGSRGAAQIGMMRALMGAGIVPDVVVGASVGALNACSLAVDPTLDRVELLADRWMAMEARHLTGPKIAVLGNLARRRPYLFSSDRIRRLVAEWMPATNIEDLVVPAYVATTNLHTGLAHHHGAGKLADALAASIAMPAVFPPVLLDTGHGFVPHVDAGISENLPLAGAAKIARAGDRVWALDVTKPPMARKLRNPLDVLVGALAISIHHRSPANFEAGVSVIPCLLTRGYHCGTVFDFSHSGQLMMLGEATVIRAMQGADIV